MKSDILNSYCLLEDNYLVRQASGAEHNHYSIE